MSKILIVDDEPLVRRTIERVLAEHEIVAVPDGGEALEALRVHHDIGLILCDILMPDITGMELYEQAGRLRPELQALFVFVTGGTLTAEIETFISNLDNPVLRKPFGVAQLRDIVARFI